MASISCLCRACYTSADHTAQIYAVDCLTMCLITEECQFPADVWIDCFDQLLLPLIRSEAEPEIVVRITNMVCKILLHRLPSMLEYPNLPSFWTRFISAMTSAALRDNNDELICTHMQESLKNVILVVAHMHFPLDCTIERNELLKSTFDLLNEHNSLQDFCETIGQELEDNDRQEQTAPIVDIKQDVSAECLTALYEGDGIMDADKRFEHTSIN